MSKTETAAKPRRAAKPAGRTQGQPRPRARRADTPPPDGTIRLVAAAANVCFGHLRYPDDQPFRNNAGAAFVDVPIASLSTDTLRSLLTQLSRVLTRGDLERVRAVFAAGAKQSLQGPADFHRAVVARQLEAPTTPHVAGEVGGSFHPVHVTAEYRSGMFGEGTFIGGKYRVGDLVLEVHQAVRPGDFRDRGGLPVARTFAEACAAAGLRAVDPASLPEVEAKRARAAEAGAQAGRVMAATGPALAHRRIGWWKDLVAVPLGTPARPVQVVVEPDLETEDDPYESRRGAHVDVQVADLPFVRVFDLGRREYVYVDVDDLAPYAYDAGAMDRLAVDPAYRRILDRVFAAGESADAVEDLVQGKHGGIIVLASGPSGVGKTMTAEVVAQATRRPLYTIGLADLRTNLAAVASNMEKILIRAERWNALLLIDEADVIMARRGEELERAAIVGLFLHRLEYFRGFLFLTSNRPESLDEAVLSRVTLHRRYPPLTPGHRRHIWAALLANAGLEVDPADVAALATGLEIDGRRIRAAVRLARCMHPAGTRLAAADLAPLVAAGTSADA